MPTTLLSLAILLVLLGPGFCYVAATERRYTARKQSAFRETVQIAAASIILNLLVLAAFWLVHSVWATGTPNVGAIVSTPHAYWEAHYRLVAGWALILFIAACVIGFLAGTFARPGKALRASAWVGMFEVYPKDQKWVGLELIDGSFLSGQLYSYSLDPEETDNRELVLRNPKYRAPGMAKLVPLGSALTTVSAGEIRFLSVTYTSLGDTPQRRGIRDRIKAGWQAFRAEAQQEGEDITVTEEVPVLPTGTGTELPEGGTTTEAIIGGNFDVVIHSRGPRRFLVLKELENWTGRNLAEMNSEIDQVDKVWLSQVDESTASRMKRALEDAGATVEIRRHQN